MDRVHLYIRPDGEVRRDGVQTPSGSVVHHRKGGIIVVKIPGHQYWSGRGQQSYAPASFIVYSVEADRGYISDDAGESVWVRRVIEFPVRKES